MFTRVSEKTTENSERLGRQARPRNEHGTSRLPIFEHSTVFLAQNKDRKINSIYVLDLGNLCILSVESKCI